MQKFFSVGRGGLPLTQNHSAAPTTQQASLNGQGPNEVEEDFASVNSTDLGSPSSGTGSVYTPPPLGRTPEPPRKWRDVFWLLVFLLQLGLIGFGLIVVGYNRFEGDNRVRSLAHFSTKAGLQTQDFWPMYGAAAGIGALLAWAFLYIFCLHTNQIIKVAVHSVTTYLAVIAVFCFWDEEIFWGLTFSIGALLQFLYAISVMDRLPFSMLVIRKAVVMLRALPGTMWMSYGFVAAMLLWLTLWSFGVAGVVASGMNQTARWWLLVAFSVSLFWTGAVFCNSVHVIVAGVISLLLSNGAQGQIALPPNPLMRSLRHAVTTSLGSICYGSLFTAAIRVLRWSIRGLRSRIGSNECLLCCVNFLFNLVETLVRFFNKYAYVQVRNVSIKEKKRCAPVYVGLSMLSLVSVLSLCFFGAKQYSPSPEVAVYGKNFNLSARDAWELFQSTGVEALIAYDLTGAILVMATVLGGLLTGTGVGIWSWYREKDRVIMVGATAMLMGMILVGLTLVVVESAVTSIYICYAEDPALIIQWDPEFADEIAENLHQRLQHRSGRDVPAHMVGLQLPKAPPLPQHVV